MYYENVKVVKLYKRIILTRYYSVKIQKYFNKAIARKITLAIALTCSNPGAYYLKA